MDTEIVNCPHCKIPMTSDRETGAIIWICQVCGRVQSEARRLEVLKQQFAYVKDAEAHIPVSA